METSKAMRMALALNSGSSSLKFGLFQTTTSSLTTVLTGEADAIGSPQSRFTARNAAGKIVANETAPIPDQRAAMNCVVRTLANEGMPTPDAIGHRMVHGGPALRSDVRISPAVLLQLEAAKGFAPLHIPVALSVIAVALEKFPNVAQVACFDTSFHRDMPLCARTLPIPRALKSEGVERYGFHGLSCESIVLQMGETIPERVIIAHLGNGSSITAVRHGKSIDTSMGLTPTGGIIMGTRTGDLDPGVLVYLLRERKLDVDQLDTLLQRESGLRGVSGVTSDMRQLRTATATNTDAQLAIDMYCISAAKQIAAMITSLDGVDAIVFTGGIGENDVQTRAAICERLHWIGVHLDASANASSSRTISGATSRCTVHVLRSEETQQIARRTLLVAQI
ncbi:MAG: acetate/propionate family kinase [Burkholderiales bacterium]|nr:acetate/propionate family kinase [Burkholderiales bacterium]